MLSDKDVSATIAVKDLSRARKFYEGTLGLQVLENMEPGGIVYKSGRSPVLVYKSTHAGTNKATAATWVVGDSVDTVARIEGSRRGVRALRPSGHQARW